MITFKHLLPFGWSWVPFWCSWLPFGCSWVPFWCSWLPFGYSWVPFGRQKGNQNGTKTRSKTNKNRRLKSRRILVDFAFPMGAKKEPKGSQNGSQNGTKTAPKTNQNRRQISTSKKKLSKTVLELCWADLGSSWVPSWNHFRALARARAKF